MAKNPDPAVGSQSMPLIELRDVLYILAMPVFAAAAWCVPERTWPSVARGLVSISLFGPGAFGKPLLRRVERAITGQSVSRTPDEICTGFMTHKFLRQFQYFRCCRPGGWHPPIRLEGREHIETALAEGHGAVLWVGQFASYDLIVKKGLHENGFAVCQLSRDTHGFSDSWFGIRTINAINRAVENRYLAERVQFSDGSRSKGARTLEHRLRENGVVAIAAVRNKGGRSIDAPFLNSRLVAGSGGASLAYITGASLLPVLTHHDEGGGFVVTVAPEIEISRDLPRERASLKALAEHAKIVEEWVLAYPDQWFGWSYLPEDTASDPGGRSVWDWINKRR